MKLPRASGVLLHVTSLPNQYGIGDLGSAAFDFVEFLKKSKQSYWQILPLGPTGYGDSPYQCFSAFAGNTNLISPEILVDENLVSQNEIDRAQVLNSPKVDFGKVIKWKGAMLEEAYTKFSQMADNELCESYEGFIKESEDWLEDYALFRAIKISQGGKSWLEWDESLRLREELALREAKVKLRDEIRRQKFYQFLFFRQWDRLKKYANDQGVRIIGDVPIFVALDSADVWCNSQEFKLEKDGSPKVVAGVPPDYFSKTGQLWGNPIYDWDSMELDGFSWWVARVKFALRNVDILRIDHFRGFIASWEVPGKDKTAEKGRWVEVPGKRLFQTMGSEIDKLPIIAEDLGDITREVRQLRDDFGFPGMRILQFGLGGDGKNRDLPHNYVKNCVAYTGTHDNDTAVGWYKSRVRKGTEQNESQSNKELDFCLKYLNSDGKEIHWDFIRAVLASAANTAVVPMQDILGLDNQARMNLPASNKGNWSWHLKSDWFADEIVERLLELTEIYGRDWVG